MDVSHESDSSSRPTSTSQRHFQPDEQDEISLIDILKFLRRQLWTVGGVTLAAILVGLGTGLLASPQARRELLLQLTTPPEMDVWITADASVIQDEIVAAGNLDLSADLAEALLMEGDDAQVSATLSEAATANPERFNMVLTSEDAAVLKAAEAMSLDLLQQTADEVVEFYIAPEIARLDLLVERTEAKIGLLESRLDSSEALSGGNSVDFSTFLQLQQQNQQQALIAQEFSRLTDYELERNSLTSLLSTGEPIVNIEVSTATTTVESGSLLQRLVLSAIAGFILGILIALIVDQLPQISAAISTPDE